MPGADQVLHLPLHRIRPNAYQPRVNFSQPRLEELARSIREHGVLQPIAVRPSGDHFELIVGERRFRAAKMAGLESIPALVRDCRDEEMLELSLMENLQREDISPVETARGFQRLADEFLYSHGEIALRVGRSRTSVANTLRLLQLPEPVLVLVDQGEISEGHARLLLMLPDAPTRVEAAEWVARNGISVRELEERVRVDTGPPESASAASNRKGGQAADPHLTALNQALGSYFGTKARVEYRGGRGAITVHFYSDEDLERILDLLGIRI